MRNSPSPPDSRTADGPPIRPRDTVGDLLRRTRVEQGGEIPQLATTLRIRASYLSAIEQGRYDRLPGPVYAIGFVRTYANALGLDGEEAVRRFKLESSGLEQRQDLSFPMPLTSRSTPGGRVVLVAVVLAVCAYAIWHYVSASDRARPERVAAVPTDLLPPPTPATAAAPAAAPAAPVAADQTGAPAASQTASTAPAPPPVAASPLPAVPSVPPSAPVAQPAASLVAPPAPVPPLSGQSASLAPPPSAPSSDSAAAPPAAAAPSTPALPPGAALVPPAAPAPPPAADQTAAATPAAPAGPRVYGAVTGPSHITLRATQDCWIQVRDSTDPAQTVVAQRTLHAGDTYRVPDRGGLVLRTGNASALQVTVDDQATPALGGTVRNVALDPTRLLAGTALE